MRQLPQELQLRLLEPPTQPGAGPPAQRQHPSQGAGTKGSRTGATIFPRRKASKNLLATNQQPILLTREILKTLENQPLGTAAEKIGVSATAFKRACRNLGIERWAYQKASSATPGKQTRRRAPTTALAAAHRPTKTEAQADAGPAADSAIFLSAVSMDMCLSSAPLVSAPGAQFPTTPHPLAAAGGGCGWEQVVADYESCAVSIASSASCSSAASSCSSSSSCGSPTPSPCESEAPVSPRPFPLSVYTLSPRSIPFLLPRPELSVAASCAAAAGTAAADEIWQGMELTELPALD